MNRGIFRKPVVVLSTFLAGAATIFAVSRIAETPTVEMPSPSERGEGRAKSSRAGAVLSESDRWEREIRSFTVEDLQAELPEKAVGTRDLSRRLEIVLRRLGELEGEAALDELFARYGKGSFTGRAMGHVLAGWLTVDRDAAMAACRKMSYRKEGDLFGGGLNWKGELIVSGLG